MAPEVDPSRPVTVVGAGPSGLSAAVTLAKAGREVVVHEARAKVGGRFNGDHQGLENWSRDVDVIEGFRNLGIDTTRFVAAPRKTSTYLDSRGTAHVARTRRPLFYLVRRGDVEGSLDRGLRDQALELGVEIRTRSRIDPKAAAAVTGGPAILATGPARGDGFVVGYTFPTDAADRAYGMVDKRAAPLGYAYYLVDNGQATVATFMPNHVGDWRPRLQATVARFSELTGDRLDIDAPGARFYSGAGTLFLEPRSHAGDSMVVGEAAGFQDAMWGFGIRNAITSGHLAAKSLLTGEAYPALLEADVLPHVRAGWSNRLIWETLGDRGFSWLIAKTVAHPDPARCMQWGFGPHRVKDAIGNALVRRYRRRADRRRRT